MALFRLIGNLESRVSVPQPIELESPTVRLALDELIKRCPGLAGELIHANGEFNRYYSIVINGEMMEFLDDLDTRLSSTDAVTILPPAPA